MKKLTNFEAREVSLVDKGANKKKRFSVYKSEGNDMPEEMLELIVDVLKTEDESDNYEELLKEMSEKGRGAARAAMKILNAFKGEMPEGLMEKLMEAGGMKKKPMEDEMKKSCASDEEQKSEDTVSKNLESLPEDVQAIVNKALEASNKEMEAVKKANEDLLKALQVEKDARRKREWTEKAENSLAKYPDSTENLVATLMELEDVKPELAEKQFELLKKAADAMSNSTLLKEFGSNASPESGQDAYSKLEAMAKGFVEKSADAKMTFEQAFDIVCQREVELYSEYLNDNPKQSGN